MTKVGNRRHGGLGLLEVMIALGLGASLSAAILQLFTSNMQVQAMQNHHQDIQQRAAYARLLLRTAIQDASAPLCADTAAVFAERPRLRIHLAPSSLAEAASGSSVLEVIGSQCEAPVSIFYIAYRGSDESNRPGLYRRQQLADGDFRAAQELVEGISRLTVSALVGQSVPPGPESIQALRYQRELMIRDGVSVLGVDLGLELTPLYDMDGAEGLSLQFSVSIRDGK